MLIVEDPTVKINTTIKTQVF